MNNLIDAIREPAVQFIKAIYNTGGEFALRGYFTKEFFDKLGFHDAVVTGCPSIYSRTPEELKISKHRAGLNPVFNGYFKEVRTYLNQYPTSLYFDQNEYFDLIYRKKSNINAKKMLQKLIRTYNYDAVELAIDNRIKLFFDVSAWTKAIGDRKINFSYGTRIHGNIIAILCGVPAVVCAIDSRTREMAEFYNIPVVEPNNGKLDLMQIYQNADYSKFNSSLSTHYDNYINFLKTHGLIDHPGKNNPYLFTDLDRSSIQLHEMNEVQQYTGYFEKHRKFLKIYSNIMRGINRIK